MSPHALPSIHRTEAAATVTKVQRELEKEKRRLAAEAREQAQEVQRVQESMNELLRARQEAERQARRDIDNARQARAASEAKSKTLQGALEATKLNAAKEVREMREELDRTLARLAALEARQQAERQKPRKLAVSFPADGSAPVLTRRASTVSVENSGMSADEARIRLLTQQNRTAKRSLGSTH
jgi:chromosome segregation ATPase